jgi:Poxvirus Late Transcription Factor VLTF3 like
MLQRLKAPVIQSVTRAASPNFTNVGTLVSRTVELQGSAPGSDAPATSSARKFEVRQDEGTNLHVLDKRVRKALEGQPQRLALYKSGVRAVMMSYSLLVPYKESEVVGEPERRTGRGRELADKKLLLIKRFADVARRFVDVALSERREDRGACCSSCERPLEDRGDVVWCPACLHVEDASFRADVPAAPEGGASPSTSIRNVNDKLNHFRLIPQLFQGKEDYDVQVEHLERIEAHAEKYEIDLESVTKDTLLHILEVTDLADDLEEHINLLHHTITGVPLPDISHLEERVFARHHEVVTVFAQMKTAGHKYTMKSWFLFYQYLVMEEYDVDPRELPIVKLPESLAWHNATMKRIAALLTEQGSQFSWHPVEVTG